MDDRELDRLFDGARRDLPAPSDLSRLRSQLKLDPPPTPPWRPWAWGAAIGVALVLAALSSLPPERPTNVPEPAPRAVAPPVASAPVPAAEPVHDAREPATPPAVEASPAPRREVAHTPRPTTPTLEAPADPPPSEATLVARAAAALRRGATTEARAALREAGERYPEGLLREERASLEVQLTLADDPAAGEAALARFRGAFPGSGHTARLERLLRAASE